MNVIDFLSNLSLFIASLFSFFCQIPVLDQGLSAKLTFLKFSQKGWQNMSVIRLDTTPLMEDNPYLKMTCDGR